MNLKTRLQRLEAIESIANNKPGVLMTINYGKAADTLGYMYGGLKLYKQPDETLEQCRQKAINLWNNPHEFTLILGFGADDENE